MRLPATPDVIRFGNFEADMLERSGGPDRAEVLKPNRPRDSEPRPEGIRMGLRRTMVIKIGFVVHEESMLYPLFSGERSMRTSAS